MYVVTTQEIVFYTAVFLVAFTVSVARSFRDSDTGGVVRGISFGVTAGFLSFGIVTVGISFGGGSVSTAPGYWACLGASALIGLLGKEQDKFARIALFKFAKKFGIDVEAMMKEANQQSGKSADKPEEHPLDRQQ